MFGVCLPHIDWIQFLKCFGQVKIWDFWTLRIEEHFPDADVPKELLKPHEQPEQPEPEAPEAPEAEVPEETEAEPPAKAEVDTPQVGRWPFAIKHGRIWTAKFANHVPKRFGMILV